MSVSSGEPGSADVTRSHAPFEGANIHLAVIWSIIAVVSACLIVASVHSLVVVAIAAGLLYSLGAIFENLVGVKARSEYVSAPIAISPRWPAFTLGRARIRLDEIDRVRPGICLFGQQTLLVDTKRGQFPVSFGNADQMAAFFELVQRARPSAKIKRYVGAL
ncbi:MAG: hypothetical protein KF904_21990 [Rhodoblastus sp.]|nr:hypothetical protein [Rhodoblastus sp.]